MSKRTFLLALSFLVLTVFSSLNVFALDLTIEASRVSVIGEDVKWSAFNKLHLLVDDRPVLSGGCGEMSHVDWMESEYNKILLQIPDGGKIRITGSVLCPFNQFASDSIKIQIVE